MGLVELSCTWRTLSVILICRRSGTDSTADSSKVTLVLSGIFLIRFNQRVKEAELIIVVHEEAFIGSSPGIIKFDVGQIFGDPVDLRSGVLRVACMMLI